MAPAPSFYGCMLGPGHVCQQNVAVTLMITPFAISLMNAAEERAADADVEEPLDTQGEDSSNMQQIQRFSIGLLLGIAYSTTAGGMATLVGSIPNELLMGLGGASRGLGYAAGQPGLKLSPTRPKGRQRGDHQGHRPLLTRRARRSHRAGNPVCAPLLPVLDRGGKHLQDQFWRADAWRFDFGLPSGDRLVPLPIEGLLYFMGELVFDVGSPFPRWACDGVGCIWANAAGVVHGVEVTAQACSLDLGDPNMTKCRLANKTWVDLAAVYSPPR